MRWKASNRDRNKVKGGQTEKEGKKSN